MSKKRILVDLDGVVVDWGKAYDEEMQGTGFPSIALQKTYDLTVGLTKDQKKYLFYKMSMLDYENMSPIPHAIQSVKRLLTLGHDVLICTSSWMGNPTCASGKVAWVVNNLGHEWEKRLILTQDKTLIPADFLIDDKPDIVGRISPPSWEQIIFTQPYNKDIHFPLRLNSWRDWKDSMLDGRGD